MTTQRDPEWFQELIKAERDPGIASRTDRMLALAFPACLTDIDPMALHAEPATAETTDCARLADAFTLYATASAIDARIMRAFSLGRAGMRRYGGKITERHATMAYWPYPDERGWSVE